MTNVVSLLNTIAAQTWHKISTGPSRGLTFGEESITNHNLFELNRLSAAIEIYKFSKAEEPWNGADFEWWLGSDSKRVGWAAFPGWHGTGFDGRVPEQCWRR